MLKGILAGEDARVRRQREDGVRVREIEEDTVAREPIEGGCRDRAAVRAERVSAQRVDRDEQNVLIRNRPEVGLGGAGAPDEKEERA